MTPDEIAAASAKAMGADDAASRSLGIAVERVAPGEAVLAMTLRADMANGHGIAHGGIVFTLADTAFAVACNSHGDKAVAHQCGITFIRPGRVGDRLVATAREVSRAGRAGITDVTVRDGSGEAIAEFRGHSRTIGGRWVEE